MQATPQNKFEQRYKELTPRQKAIVDARVENPDEPNRAIANEIAPEIFNARYLVLSDDEEPIDNLNESYTSQILNKDEIAELVKHRRNSDVDTSNAATAHAGMHAPTDSADDSFIPDSSIEVASDNQGVVLRMDWQTVESALNSQQLPAELHQALVSAVVAKASE